MTLKYVIFDVDGTLSETEDLHRQSFNAAFADFGWNFTWDQALYGQLLRIGGGRERLRHYLETIASGILKDPEADHLIARVHAHKTTLFQNRLASGQAPLRPGVARLITEIRDHPQVGLAIATTTHRGNVETLLGHQLGAESLGWFQCLACAEQAPAKKPSPDVYLWLLDQLAVAPDQCIAIEDSLNGLHSARVAGIPVVITVDPYTEGGDFSGALAVFSDLGEPSQPFRVLAGPQECIGPSGHVDLALLQRLHGLVG